MTFPLRTGSGDLATWNRSLRIRSGSILPISSAIGSAADLPGSTAAAAAAFLLAAAPAIALPERLKQESDAKRDAAQADLAERALAGLPPKDRQALILSDALGHTAAEVGQMMGCTALAVRLRLHRARRAMRQAAERLLDGMGSAK